MKKLDVLAIPFSKGKIDLERHKKAEEVFRSRDVDSVIILNGLDSEEDILYLGKILKPKMRVGIITFPLHFLEYKTIIRRAIRDENFHKNIFLENIKVNQNFKRELYGVAGLIEEELRFGKVKYRRFRHEKWLIKIKRFFHKLISL